MGQKTHPKMFRLGVIETWDSKWFARHDYPKLLHEDFRIKKFLKTPALSRGHFATSKSSERRIKRRSIFTRRVPAS